MSMRTFYAIFSLLVLSSAWATASAYAQSLAYSGSLSFKTKYVGKLGTTVDDNPVLQPYVEVAHDNGFYGYVWLNVPLTSHNPNRSAEFEPSVGYRRDSVVGHLDLSLTLFDIQNPNLLDFAGDILSPKIHFSRQGYYFEYLYYAADREDDGQLVEIGKRFTPSNSLSMSVNMSYVEGPFTFEPIVYVRFKTSYDLANSPWQLSLDVLELIQQSSPDETREDRITVGLSYLF